MAVCLLAWSSLQAGIYLTLEEVFPSVQSKAYLGVASVGISLLLSEGRGERIWKGTQIKRTSCCARDTVDLCQSLFLDQSMACQMSVIDHLQEQCSCPGSVRSILLWSPSGFQMAFSCPPSAGFTSFAYLLQVKSQTVRDLLLSFPSASSLLSCLLRNER